MHRISLAPVLSATRSRDSCWITSVSYVRQSSVPRRSRRVRSLEELLGLLEDLDNPPALRRRQRPGLHEQHPVTDATRVLLVMRLQLAGTTDDLAVQRVLDLVLDRNDDGLVHLVADHEALPDLASPANCRVGLLCHDATSATASGAAERPSSRSRMIV